MADLVGGPTIDTAFRLISPVLHEAAEEVDRLRAEITRLRAALTACEADRMEQARLNGMGSEREARLMAERDELKRERDQLRSAIFGRSDYCEMLRQGNFTEMIRATEAGRLGAIARAEAAEATIRALTAKDPTP